MEMSRVGFLRLLRERGEGRLMDSHRVGEGGTTRSETNRLSKKGLFRVDDGMQG